MIGAAEIFDASILIVDDQEANVLLLEQMLRGAGYTSVASTRDPRAVCELQRTHRYSLILLDLQMPGMDGFQVLEDLKDIEKNTYLPVLVVTAQPGHKLRALQAGAKDFVSKPFDLAEVLMRVRNMLEVRLLHEELGRSRDQLEQLASLDALTGIANRRRFDAAFDDEWRRAVRARHRLSIAIVDVDHFKHFNDRHGHLAGDERLRAIANSLATTRRAGDLVARYGGEEFGVILPEVESTMMHDVMRAMMTRVSSDSINALAGPGRELVTVSVGAISVLPERDDTPAGALAQADRLLYEAKGAGRDRGMHLDLSTLVKTHIDRTTAHDDTPRMPRVGQPAGPRAW